jgi:hypothetical protein
MAEDWAADVRKYAPNADEAVIAGIVRYCGIALRKRDSSLVSMSDPKETGRVRENFLKKKLGLVEADEVLDAAITAVGETMRAQNFKNRVTVYYLLADRFGALEMFRKAPRAAKAAAATSATPEAEDEHTLGDTIAELAHGAGAVAGAVAGAFAGTGIGAGAVAGDEAAELATEEIAPTHAERAHDPAPPQALAASTGVEPTAAGDAAGGSSSLWLWLLIALLVIVVLWWVFGRG